MLRVKLEEMADENRPIKVNFGDQGTSYIYYQDSELLTIIKYFPLTQILIIAVFAAIAYLLFSFARKSEQIGFGLVWHVKQHIRLERHFHP